MGGHDEQDPTNKLIPFDSSRAGGARRQGAGSGALGSSHPADHPRGDLHADAVEQQGAVGHRPGRLTFVETSALLAWLLGEAAAPQVELWIDDAESVCCSELTFLEGHRALARLRVQGAPETELQRAARVMEGLRREWFVASVSHPVLLLASEPFLVEHIRSLDAIHVATARILDDSLAEGLRLLALDARVRLNGIAYGFEVVPPPTQEEREEAARRLRVVEPRLW